MKLETGKTYLMLDGTQVRINHEQSYLGFLFKTYRTTEGTTEHWFSDGGHKTGNNALRLIMEMPAVAPPTPAPVVIAAPVPAAAPVAPTVAPSTPGSVIRIEIDRDTLAVRSVTLL